MQRAAVFAGNDGIAQVEGATHLRPERAEHGQPGITQVDGLGAGIVEIDRVVEPATAQLEQGTDLPVVDAQLAGDPRPR